MKTQIPFFWALPPESILTRLQTSSSGLGDDEAAARLEKLHATRLKPKRRTAPFGLFIGQFKSPIILILISAAALSLFLHETTDAVIILGIVLVSGVLGFWQEYGAINAVARLRALVETKTRVLWNGRECPVPG